MRSYQAKWKVLLFFLFFVSIFFWIENNQWSFSSENNLFRSTPSINFSLTIPHFYLCPSSIPSSSRIGNLMFLIGSLYGLAKKNGGKLLIPDRFSYQLKKVFQMRSFEKEKSEQLDMICRSNSKRFLQERWPSKYDPFFETTIETLTKKKITKKNNNNIPVFSFGYYLQSYKYFEKNEISLMRNEFKFQEWIEKRAERMINRFCKTYYFRSFLEKDEESNDNKKEKKKKKVGFILVGIHIRRGDLASASAIKQGYTMATWSFISRAMNFMEKQIGKKKNHHILFLVATDDLKWAKQSFKNDSHAIIYANDLRKNEEKMDKEDEINEKPKKFWKKKKEELMKMKFFDENMLAAVLDLALLSKCDHLIMTVGSYGWWAAKMVENNKLQANKKKPLIIYYKNYPQANSIIASGFDKNDYFPKSWRSLQ